MSQIRVTTEKAQTQMNAMYEAIGSFKKDISSYIDTRIPIFAVETKEEERFIQYMGYFAIVNNRNIYIWDIVRGLVNLQTGEKVGSNIRCENILNHIYNKYTEEKSSVMEVNSEKGIKGDIYLLCDMSQALQLLEIKRILKYIYSIDSVVSAIMIGYELEDQLDPEMKLLIPILKTPKPKTEELKALLNEKAMKSEDQFPGIIKYMQTIENKLAKIIIDRNILDIKIIFADVVENYKKHEKK